MGLRSLAKASAPTRKASSGNGTAAGKRVHDERSRAWLSAQCLVRSLRQGAAGIEILLYGGIVPIGEVGDEVQQREAQDVPMSFVSAVEPASSSPAPAT
jgi:hypothetical protein